MEECTKESCCKKTSVTEADVEAAIENESYGTLGIKTTYCVLTLKNGFEIVGTSACVDAANYSLEIGREYAKKKAVEKVWEHLASILQQQLHVVKEVCGEEPVQLDPENAAA